MANKQIVKQLTYMATLSSLIYLLAFTLPFLLPQYYSTIPPVDYTKLTNYSLWGLMVYIVGVGVLFGLYIQAIRLTWPNTETLISIRFILLTSTLFAIILIFSYPLTAIDLFIYAIRTRGWALYGLNPLATAPEILPSTDPWLELAGEWVDAASPYGPVWEWLSLSTFYLSGGAFLGHLMGLKTLAALAYLGCVWLIYKILQQLQPTWALTGTIAFAWNPLVLFESIQNGHNDIVMMFFLLAAIWIFETMRGQQASALPLLTVCLFLAFSILIKFVTIIIVPFFLLDIMKQQTNWRSRLILPLVYGFIMAILVTFPMYLLWPGQENWAVLQASNQAGRSLLALLILGLRTSFGTNVAFDIARTFILTIFALIYLYGLWRIYNRPQPRPISPDPSPILPSSRLSPCLLLFVSFLTLFWYVLLAAPVFHAWYLLWFLPLASLLLPYHRPLLAAIVFSMTALLIIPYFETIRVWYLFLLQNQFIGHLIGVPLLIVPPALVMLWPIRPGINFEV